MVYSRWSIVLICLVIFLAGCGNDQYAVERDYWRLQKQTGKIFKNPNASPPSELERVVKLLNDFARRHSDTNFANFALDAEFNIARLYLVKEEYDKARAYLKTLLDKYKESKGVSAEIIYLLGNSFEIQEKWNLALEQYKKILQQYPTTLRGLNIPIYIAQYYKVKYQPDKMIAAFKEAITHYQALANKYPNSVLGFQSNVLVSQCYMALKDWQQAINSLNSVIDKYKDKINPDGIMMDIALIYNRELKDNVKAKETLGKLIKEYPQSRLVKTATALLKEWSKNE